MAAEADGGEAGTPEARRAPDGPSSASLLVQVRAALASLGIDPSRADPRARLVDDLELDSLDWVDLAQRLEEALPVHVREERLASLPTVADLVALLRVRLEEGARGGGAAR